MRDRSYIDLYGLDQTCDHLLSPSPFSLDLIKLYTYAEILSIYRDPDRSVKPIKADRSEDPTIALSI
jgi:hypothetical protein